MDDVWIYGTNIFMLYDDIANEYGNQWTDEEIDLPFVISKKQKYQELCYKIDFTYIMLVFDYERHDPNFSDEKILEMQKYFSDVTDVGRLYINYPMIESYQHLKSLPDDAYAERKISVSLQPGVQYKQLVKRETMVEKYMNFSYRLSDLLKNHYEVYDEIIRNRCFDLICNLSDTVNLEEKISNILQMAISDTRLQTAKNHIKDWVIKQEYVCNGKTYWQYMREIFCQIIIHNIRKANLVQNGCYQIREDEYRIIYENLDFLEILKEQNLVSSGNMGYIWVLNTCVFLVAEYNFSLIENYI